MLHTLKSTPFSFKRFRTGKIHSDVRINDRNYSVNDTLIINEYEITGDYYTGRYVRCTITNIIILDILGIQFTGYVLLYFSITD